jgi:hypothetical protein
VKKKVTTSVVFSKAPYGIIAGLFMIILTTLIFAWRYQPAFTLPNFYAEDGSIFVSTVLEYGPLAALTAFNGYLVVGQYLVTMFAVGLNAVFGGEFSNLPFLVAVASCCFLGLTATLPFLLLRRQMGWFIAALTAVLLALTPLPGSDYAVIGTIGNLKFAFMFWAVIFVLYRNQHSDDSRRTFFADAILLLCVLTNITTIAVLPGALWPYRHELLAALKSKFNTAKSLLKNGQLVSIMFVIILSFMYGFVVYLKGIPVIPDYLDSAYDFEATDNIAFRITAYALLFPFASIMTDVLALATMAVLFLLLFVVNDRRRLSLSFILFAVIIMTFSFVVSRTGIADFMLIYIKSPDQFFYAQSMLMIFGIMWAMSPHVSTLRAKAVIGGVALLFILVSTPYGSSFGANRQLYESRGDITTNLQAACDTEQKRETVDVAVYPSDPWMMTVDRSIACD